jgi:hypothetical protein
MDRYMTDEQCMMAYVEFVQDFTSTAGFAEFYNLSLREADDILHAGRSYFTKEANGRGHELFNRLIR